MKTDIKPKECRNPDCNNTFTPRKSFDKYCSYNCAKPFLKPLKRTPIENKPFWGDDKVNPLEEKKKRKRIKRPAPIKPVSNKMKKELAKYHKDRLVFLQKPENKICPVTNSFTTEVHHKMGRVGYADQWARDNDITLLHDQRFWLAVSRKGHQKIEENPEWAKENGFSVDRL